MTEYSEFERQQLQAVADFNNACLPGNWVSYKTIGGVRYGQTLGKAMVVGSGSDMNAVVAITGGNRNFALSEVTVIPPQPDEIEDDSRDLPEPVGAAGRVREYIAANGDGIYDVLDGHPLYARDMEAICRAVLDRAGVPA
ncbi:hypothetical protein [Verrucosispora sp. NA02020]|uniref:hypothetical protein n=1 Tax=Verrucosispora sp. NA02020 TaxID=2742132 RepID=UPI0015921DD1|nr:hypothetical protein [Verrucosispora sp. NA02020]QKW15328.1 hypothetical protein HUT12_22915 [Verrucosispora sp. NA02020]